jgi:hypothetical protein
MNYKLRFVLNALINKEKKLFILYGGQKLRISAIGNGKHINISVENEESYKTRGAEAFLKRAEIVLKQQDDAAQDGLAQIQNDIFKVLALYDCSGLTLPPKSMPLKS